MAEFTPDEARRWAAWERANAESARRTDRIVRVVGITMVAATLIALAVALWLR
jgi:hypothetical protein